MTAFEENLRQALLAAQLADGATAQRHLRLAMALQADSPIPHLLMAAEFAAVGEVALAEASYGECLARSPGSTIARFQLGLLQLTSGRVQAARASWGPLLESDAEPALTCFAAGLLEIQQGQVAQARDLIREGMALNHDNPPLNADMAGVLGRLEQAMAADAPPQPAVDHFLIGAYRQQP